ncbi:MAG: GNAT family N-acetyltransferase [Clostridiales bacterium]|nr:GNAT family N-acetyltransferase [Clostridiales bacterium]
MADLVLRRTMDFKKMIPLLMKSGLEVHEDDEAGEGLVTLFELVDPETEELVGTSGVEISNGSYMLRYIAVDEKYRGKQYGRLVVEAALDEARACGAKEIWLTGKIPEFYKKWGFELMDPADAPIVSDCQSCPQFHNGCESALMRAFL